MMRVFAFIFLVVAVRASELGQVGTCVEMCSSDSECPAGQACLSNGCGHTCQTAVTLPDKKCQPVLCLMYCEYGWVRDDDGCEICACNWDPILSTPAALSSDLGEAGACVEMCSSDSQCPSGQACLSNGCGHTCQTAVTLPGDKKCEPVRCRMYCQNGWVKDDNGCEICECNWKPIATESPGAVDKRGACVDECTMTNSIFKSAMGWQQCPEGQSCASNGCGHTCQPDTTSKKSNKKCQDVVCYMFCENGWAKDDDGCEICACA